MLQKQVGEPGHLPGQSAWSKIWSPIAFVIELVLAPFYAAATLVEVAAAVVGAVIVLISPVLLASLVIWGFWFVTMSG